ncbi:MAG TPA: hypothetical protein VGQ73_09365 [Gemmatimonadales bacterium]|jgi:hypothetical protein|nr:hypothetical protein [Gemmatimonadales bacterium]
MCPACFTTVALIAAGASSTAGLTALVIRALRAKSGAESADRQSEPEIEPCGTTQSYN